MGLLVEAWGETEKGMNTNELVELALTVDRYLQKKVINLPYLA